MAEDMCAAPGIIKKAHLDEDSNKEERVVDIYVSSESLTVYENPWVEGTPPNIPRPAVPEHPVTEARIVSKRNLLRVSAVFVGLLCLLLAVNIGLGIQRKTDKIKWIKERNQLLNNNTNLLKKTDQLIANNSQLIRERNDLLEKLDEISSSSWEKFGSSYYSLFDQRQPWQKSKNACEKDNAHLVVISSEKEEAIDACYLYVSLDKALHLHCLNPSSCKWVPALAGEVTCDGLVFSLGGIIALHTKESRNMHRHQWTSGPTVVEFIITNVLKNKNKAWIGLKILDIGDWQWVDGTPLTHEQSDRVTQLLKGSKGNCVVIQNSNDEARWQMQRCSQNMNRICQKRID